MSQNVKEVWFACLASFTAVTVALVILLGLTYEGEYHAPCPAGEHQTTETFKLYTSTTTKTDCKVNGK